MRKSGKSNEALIIDDEPEYLEWVVEYLAAKKLQVNFARNLPEALDLVQTKKFRLVLVDMNIPPLNAVTPEMRNRTPLIDKYPGIAVAVRCRNLGYGAHSVIAYTVHDDEAADAELSKLNCRYVLKGRPEVLKRVVEKSLAPKPAKISTKTPDKKSRRSTPTTHVSSKRKTPSGRKGIREK